VADKVLSSITANISLEENIVLGHQAEFGCVSYCVFRIVGFDWFTPLLSRASTEFIVGEGLVVLPY